MILFAAAGFAGWHFFQKDWAPPAGLLMGFFVAPMVPVKNRAE